jgi:hypothetical protein
MKTGRYRVGVVKCDAKTGFGFGWASADSPRRCDFRHYLMPTKGLFAFAEPFAPQNEKKWKR